MTRDNQLVEKQAAMQRELLDTTTRVAVRWLMIVLAVIGPAGYMCIVLKNFNHVWWAVLLLISDAMILTFIYQKLYKVEINQDADIRAFCKFLAEKKLYSEKIIDTILSNENKQIEKELRQRNLAIGIISGSVTVFVSISGSAILARVRDTQHLGYEIATFAIFLILIILIVVLLKPFLDKILMTNYAIKEATVELLEEAKLEVLKKKY
ncbi:hypothetical protein [Lactiplantibacillus herbarum]|uniref:hypothetical protein n=1 Tax=Lactiplantibacillus herbarum TaxID=1670446 RepID=UPI00064FAD39|nr:hypothetical protein [Lactiplantibacillus herbarum]